MEVIDNYKSWLDSYGDTYMFFFCLLSDGFFQIMCIASFNFNLNALEGESYYFKTIITTKCLTSFIII